MEMNAFFRSIVEQDLTSVVICDLTDTIIYMNPAAVANYAKRGGAALIGRSLLDCHNDHSRELIRTTVEWFKKSPENNRVFEFRNEKQNKDVYMVALRDENKNLIGYYEKHEFRNLEEGKPFDYK